MNIFSDNSSYDINIFEDDELYKHSQNSIDPYFSPAVSEDEKDKEDPFTIVFPPCFTDFEDQPTNFETKKKDNSPLVNNSSDNSDIKMPKSFIFDDILKIVKQKYNGANKILDNFAKDEKIEKYENALKSYDMNLLKKKEIALKIKEKKMK